MRGMKRTAADAASRFKAQQEAGAADGDDTAHGVNGINGEKRNGV